MMTIYYEVILCGKYTRDTIIIMMNKTEFWLYLCNVYEALRLDPNYRLNHSEW
jgi:hypothetical protein